MHKETQNNSRNQNRRRNGQPNNLPINHTNSNQKFNLYIMEGVGASDVNPKLANVKHWFYAEVQFM
jgi:hypothetical protein